MSNVSFKNKKLTSNYQFRELRSASRQSLKRKLPNEERQVAKKVTRHKPHANQASETTRKQIKTNKTPNDIKLDLFSVNNPQKHDEDTTDDHLVSSSSQTRLSMSLRSKQSPNNLASFLYIYIYI